MHSYNNNLSISPAQRHSQQKNATCRNTNAADHFIAVVSTNSQFKPGTSGTCEIDADSSARLVSYMMGGPGRIPLSKNSGFEPLHRRHQGQVIRHQTRCSSVTTLLSTSDANSHTIAIIAPIEPIALALVWLVIESGSRSI